MELKDALLKATLACPNGSASASVSSSGIDTGTVPNSTKLSGIQPGNVELILSAPALTATELPDTKTMTYDVVAATAADFSDAAVIQKAAITQTGASSAGAAAATKRLRLDESNSRYIGLQITNSGAGDASGKSATLEVAV